MVRSTVPWRSARRSGIPYWGLVVVGVAGSACGKSEDPTESNSALELEDGQFILELVERSREQAEPRTSDSGENEALQRTSFSARVRNIGSDARDVVAWVERRDTTIPGEALARGESSNDKLTVEHGRLSFGDISQGQHADAEQTFDIVHPEDISIDASILSARISGGVLLDGDTDSSARDALKHMSVVGVEPDDVDDGLIMVRLDAWISPDATVGDVNEALEQSNARIVTMDPQNPAATLSVPRATNRSELEEMSHAIAESSGFSTATPGRTAAPAILPHTNFSQPVLDHHFPTRMPAAWNLRELVSSSCSPALVMIPDSFVEYLSNTRVELPRRSIPAHSRPSSNPSQSPPNQHGFAVASIAAAAFDSMGIAGTNPWGWNCVTILPVEIDGVTMPQVITRTSRAISQLISNGRLPAGDQLLLNVSLGYRPCPIDNTPAGTAFGCSRALNWRIRDALSWASLTRPHWDNFFVTSAAGNNAQHDYATFYPGMGRAFSSIFTNWMAGPRTMFDLATDADLWRSTDPNVPDITLSSTDERLLRRESRLLGFGPDGPPATPNTLVVGATNRPPPSDPDAVARAAYSFREPDLVAPGEVIVNCPARGPCISLFGTSHAAPQVAGLASYLWLLSSGLRDEPPPTTRRAILANTRIVGDQVVLDGYAAALSLDRAVLPTSAATSPMRAELLDVDNSNRFDDVDVGEFLVRYFETSGGPTFGGPYVVDSQGRGVEVSPTDRDFGRYDLNGDGFTGGGSRTRFDLNREGSARFGPTLYTSDVVQQIGGEPVSFDENALTDLQVLCYYAYSGLFNPVAGTSNRDALQCRRTRYEIIAHTPVMSAQNVMVEIGRGPSINNLGHVAYVARTRDRTSNRIVLKSDSQTELRDFPVGVPFSVDSLVQTNDRNQIIWIERSNDGLLDFVKRLELDQGTLIGAGSRTPRWVSSYTGLGAGATLDNSGRVVFHALRSASQGLSSRSNGSEQHTDSGDLGASTFFPMTADTGATVVRGSGTNPQLILFTDEDLSEAVLYDAPEFLSFGARPGISDDGSFVSFTAQTSTGIHVFVQDIQSPSGISVDSIVAIAGPDDFSAFSFDDRVAINRLSNSSPPRYRVTYAAARNDPTLGEVPGYYSSDFSVQPDRQIDVAPPRLLLERGDRVGLLPGRVTNVFSNDPVNTNGEIALWAEFGDGVQAVVRITPARVP